MGKLRDAYGHYIILSIKCHVIISKIENEAERATLVSAIIMFNNQLDSINELAGKRGWDSDTNYEEQKGLEYTNINIELYDRVVSLIEKYRKLAEGRHFIFSAEFFPEKNKINKVP